MNRGGNSGEGEFPPSHAFKLLSPISPLPFGIPFPFLQGGRNRGGIQEGRKAFREGEGRPSGACPTFGAIRCLLPVLSLLHNLKGEFKGGNGGGMLAS